MWSTAKWRTAIPAELVQQEPAHAADQEGSADAASAARAIAAAAVVGVAVVLAVLQAMVGFGRISGPTVAGRAAVAAGGVKFAVMAGGLAVRWWQRPRPWFAAAPID